MRQKIAFILTVLSALLLLGLVGCGGETTEKPATTPETKPVEKEKKVEANPLEMAFVPAGKCVIGGLADDPVTKFSSPPHDVELKAFWIDRYEVTFEEFMEFVADTGYETQGNWKDYYSFDNADRPVFNVTLKDAQAYAEWVGKRLPTNEEWEKAASWDEVNQAQRRYPWGDEWKDSASNTAETTQGHPMAIGEYAGDVSFYGVNDMLGNIYEWTASEYERYPGSKFNDPNYKLKLIVVKGAQFGIQGKVWHLSARSAFPRNSITAQGFRCVRDATPEDESLYSEQVKGGTPVIQVWEKPAQ